MSDFFDRAIAYIDQNNLIGARAEIGLAKAAFYNWFDAKDSPPPLDENGDMDLVITKDVDEQFALLYYDPKIESWIDGDDEVRDGIVGWKRI